MLTNGQYEDLVYFIVENMAYNLLSALEKVALWAEDKDQMSGVFAMFDKGTLEVVRNAALELTTQLWIVFQQKNMFDILGHENLSFPYVLTGIVGPNLILEKDNVISSTEINLYGH